MTGPTRPSSARGSCARYWPDPQARHVPDGRVSIREVGPAAVTSGHDKPALCCYIAGMSKVEIIEGADDKAVAEWIAQRLKAALATTADEIAITVPGGATPFPIFDLLARMRLPWHRVVVWPGDDRIVAEDHPASNLGKIRARLEPAGAQIVPLSEDAQPPHFTLAWLGMGSDGHIASLFPNTHPRIDDPHAVRRLTPDPLPPEAPFDRVSLTIPSLVDSDEVMFVIRGAGKRALFDAAARGEHDLPVARLLRAARRKVTCFC